MALTPTNSVRFRFANLALEGAERLMLMGPIGTGGTATSNTPYKITSVAVAQDLFGASQVVDATRIWFASRLAADRELWAFGFDDTGWAANTWTLTAAAGTATAGGTLVLRFGDYTIPVTILKGDDEDAVAAAIDAAVSARTDVPATAAAVANVVTLTSGYLGLEANRIPVSIDLYGDRGELGVPGVSVTVANNDAGSGEPGALDSTNLAEVYDFWAHANQGTAFLDSLEEFLDSQWDQKNNYARAIKSIFGTDQAAVVALTDSRNDQHHTYIPQKNAPYFELSQAVRVWVEALKVLDRPAGAGGFRSQSIPLPGNPPTEPNFDSEAMLQAGQSPLRVSRNGAARIVRLVGNRRENDEGVEDLRLFDFAAYVRVRELGRRMVAENARHLDKGIIAVGQVPAARVAAEMIDEEQYRLAFVAVFTQAAADGLITRLDPNQPFDPTAVIASITKKMDGGIQTGFDMIVNPEVVQNVVELETLANLA